MSDAFDPYYKWLGIRPEDQPPHHYRLLALSLFEADADVIASAADQRMSHLRSMQTGKHAALSQQLLNEISAAKICLLNPEKKAEYDRKLRAKNAPAPVLQAQPLTPAAPSATAGLPAATSLAIKALSTPDAAAKKLPTAKPTAKSADPIEDVLAIENVGRPSSSKRTAKRPTQKRRLSAILAAGGLAAIVAGGVAVWLLGQRAAPAPDAMAPNAATGKLAANDALSHSTGNSSVRPTRAADDETKTKEITPPVSAANANGEQPEDPPLVAAIPSSAVPSGIVPKPAIPKPGPQVTAPPTNDLDGMDTDEEGQDEPDETAGGEEPQPKSVSPATPKPTPNRRESVDLLKLIDPARDSVVGQWKLEAGALVSPLADTWGRLQVPYTPPPAYQWTTVVERVAGNDSLSMGMVVGTSQPQVVLDGWGNQKSGVAMVDARWGDWNETTANVPNILQGGPHTIVCRVHPDRIEVQVDDRKLIDWRGDSRRLAIDPRTLVPKRDQLYLVTYRTSYRITKMELEPLDLEPAGNPVKPNGPIVSVVPRSPNIPAPNTPGPIPSGKIPLVNGVQPPTVIQRPTRPTRPGGNAAKPAVKSPPVIRVAVPSAEQQEKAKRLVLDVFKTELAAVKKSENRVPFARSLLNQAGQLGDDQAARYVLLQMSSELAAEGGDLALALEAADALVAAFDVSASAVKVDALTAIAPSKIAAHSRPQAAEMALGVADECVSADDYDRATQAVKLATSIAHSSKDANIIKTASRRSKEIAALASSFAAVQPQLSALRQNPGDAAANLAAGKWYCLAKEDWDKGLPLLAAGSDPALKALAAQEMLKPTDAAEMAKLADQWWDFSAQQPDAIEKKALVKRAAYWYAAAEPQLQGLTKTKAQMRLNAGSQKVHKTVQVSAKTCIGHATRTLPADAATGIEVHKGQRVFIHARGKWHVSKKGKPVGAEHLVVAIGSADKPALQTVSGDQQEFLADASGELFLGIRDTSPASNSGHMEVEIEIK